VTRKSNPHGIWYLVWTGIFAAALVIGLVSLRPIGSLLNRSIRAVALLGYLTVFVTIVSAPYMRQVYRLFGRSFVKVHHILSVSGLILLTVHPIGAAIQYASLAVWVPRFGSLAAFFQWGGAPAWYLLGLGALAAVLRKPIGQNWRLVHMLNYVAFMLASIHALQLGAEFQWPGAVVLVVVLILAATAAFIQKRLQRHGRGSRT
jgi:DMSO/TMAO reductase YedYZ heme-binding membrane subunit